MTSRRYARRLVSAGAAVALLAVAPACGSPERAHVKDLRDALARTSRVSYQFSYQEITNEGDKTEVQGLVEDDLRYQALVKIDDKPVLEEIVKDDTLADRFLDPEFIPRMVRKDTVPSTPDRPEGEVTGAELGTALRTGKWVIDGAGAPSLLGALTTNERREVGQDPIFDAATVFEYVQRVSRSQLVRRFNPDALDYKPKEDPFPKPDPDSGVVRYDTILAPVPRPSDTSGGQQAIPREQNFRKLAVYVKDGYVIRILEDMDVASRLDDIERNYDLKFEGTTRARVAKAVDAINVVRKGQGELTPLRVRKLSVSFKNHASALRVRDPGEGVKGNLAVLINRGKVTGASTGPASAPADDDQSAAADAASSGTTTPPATTAP